MELKRLLLVKRENYPPIIPHVNDGPSTTRTFVEAMIELADMRVTIISPLAFIIGVVHEEAKPQTCTGSCPFQHFKITVGIAACHDRLATNVLVDTDRLTCLIIDEIQF
ncbi:MAG: hypothetical protein V2J65_27180, partial [Desulfobacteraceae bacterium]|nr:hypothetical protein [Desulfobacteraceae bacterium]